MNEVEVMLQYAQSHPVGWGLLLLMLAAAIEYVVPPFPGDTVTVVGAILIPTAGWPLIGVFGALMVGSMLGAALDWWLGYWLAETDHHTFLHRWLARPKVAQKIDKIKVRFQKHGSWYIALNRFLPAFRSLFFVAAGLAGLDLKKVLAFAALSAALWNAALLAVGYFVGYNLDALMALVDQYTKTVLVVVGLVVLAWALFKFVRHDGGGAEHDEGGAKNETESDGGGVEGTPEKSG